MWGDMFFRLAGGDYFTNFNQNPELGEIPEEVRQLVPENIHLVYWDYFSRDRQSYERNIDAHNAIKSGSWFAGGLWTWAGFAPHNTFSIATMREAMKACHAKGVENVVMTMWGDNGAECSKFAVLPALFTVSQMAQDIDDVETIHANFEREFGIPFEDFRALDLIGTQNDSAEAIYNPEKYLLYCDPFMGQFDNRVKSGDAAGYADCAARLSRYESHAEYGYLFRSLRALCAFLSVKADLGIRTRAAYLSGDKKPRRRSAPIMTRRSNGWTRFMRPMSSSGCTKTSRRALTWLIFASAASASDCCIAETGCWPMRKDGSTGSRSWRSRFSTAAARKKPTDRRHGQFSGMRSRRQMSFETGRRIQNERTISSVDRCGLCLCRPDAGADARRPSNDRPAARRR